MAEIQASDGIARRTVAFGMPPSVSMVMSVPLAETVRVEHPLVRLQPIEAMSGFIKTWIENRTVGIGFLYNIDRKKTFTPCMFWMRSCTFFRTRCLAIRLRTGSALPLARLARLNLILPPPFHGLRKVVEHIAALRAVSLNAVFEWHAMTRIKELVARGPGYTILAHAAAFDFVARGALVISPITESVMARQVCLVRNPAHPQSNACGAVEGVVLDVARDLVQRGIWEGRLALGL